MSATTNTEKHNDSAEERRLDLIDKSYIKMSDGSSKVFYASLILFSILSLIITYVYLSNKREVVKFSSVFDSFKWETFLLLFLIFLIIMFLYSLPMFFKYNSKTKSRNFGLIYKSIAVEKFFGIVTVCGIGAETASVKYLVNNKVSVENSVNLTLDKKFVSRFSNLIYFLTIFIVGLIFYTNSVNIWLIILVLSYLIYNIGYVLTVVLFVMKKKFTIELISKLIKFLNRIGLVKNFEQTYTRAIDKLVILTRGFKYHKALIVINVFCNFLISLLKSVILYYAMVSLNYADMALLWEILYKCVVLEIIIYMWPLPKGIVIYEILFLTLFKNVFFDGYVYWGLLIYRLFDYFIYVLQYLFVLAIDKIKNRSKREKALD